MSRDKVAKLLEVRLFSLAIVAVLLFFLFMFFFFFFLWQGQYVYSVVMVILATVMFVTAIRLLQYGKMFRKSTAQ